MPSVAVPPVKETETIDQSEPSAGAFFLAVEAMDQSESSAADFFSAEVTDQNEPSATELFIAETEVLELMEKRF